MLIKIWWPYNELLICNSYRGSVKKKYSFKLKGSKYLCKIESYLSKIKFTVIIFIENKICIIFK